MIRATNFVSACARTIWTSSRHPRNECANFSPESFCPHHTVEARFVELRTVDDFLAFDAVRRYALTRESPLPVSREFKLDYLPESEPHDCEWLRCSNFSIRCRGSQPVHEG